MNGTPDLNAMVLFARVLQHGSFSEAARRTGTPVSTLSRKVSALERQLGVRLLERTTRAVNPTDSGREYFQYCEQIVDALDGAQAALKKRQAAVSGTLRLAAPPSLSDVLLIPLVDGFLRRYPKVAVKVLVTDRHLDLVQDEVDISLRVGPQPASSLVFRRLLSYRHILVAAPAYLDGAEALDEPADLTRHRLLGFSKWFDGTTWKLSNGSRTERVPAKLCVGINSARPPPGWASPRSRPSCANGSCQTAIWCRCWWTGVSRKWICPRTISPGATHLESWSCFSGIASRMPRRSHARWLRLSSHHVVA